MIDLHIHTTYSSDGQYTPEEIVSMAAAKGLRSIALCDHMDITAAREGLHAAGTHGVEFFTGTELSTSWNGREYHLLCYGFDPDGTLIQGFIRFHSSRIWACLEDVLQYFRDMGFRIDAGDIRGWGRSVPTGVTMLDALVKSNPDDERLCRYTHGDRSGSPYLNFYQDFSLMGLGRAMAPALPELTETVSCMKGCGVLVLAHPGDIDRDSLRKLKGLGLKGIEVYSSHHGAPTTAYLADAARELRLFASAGSDFHGERIKPDIVLGTVSGRPDPGLMDTLRAATEAWEG